MAWDCYYVDIPRVPPLQCQRLADCMILDNFCHLESVNGFYIEKVMVKVSKVFLSLHIISQLF